MRQYRQGDVFIEEVARIPDTAAALPIPPDNTIVVREGERTGHAHRITLPDLSRERAELYADGDDLILKAAEAVTVTHEEHESVTIPPGTHRFGGQVQYNPENEHHEEYRGD